MSANFSAYHAFFQLSQLQNVMCVVFLKQMGANLLEIDLAQQHMMNLEMLWSLFSIELQKRLATCRFLAHLHKISYNDDDCAASFASVLREHEALDNTIIKLRRFSELSIIERTQKYQDVPQIVALGAKHAIWMMSDSCNDDFVVTWNKILNDLDKK